MLGIDLNAEAVYMIGHALGLMPASTTSLMQQEMDKWAKKLVPLLLACSFIYTCRGGSRTWEGVHK